MGRMIIRSAWIATLVFVMLLALAVVIPQGRTAIRTALLLPQILPAIPIKPQEWMTVDPVRREVAFPLDSGNGVADLYTPGQGITHPAILLFLGVNPAGRDDPRVVGLADGLSRAGIVVMIPWSESMIQRRIEVQEIDNLVWAFQYLRNLDMVDPDRVGMSGFCVGASFSAVAAQDPRIRNQVRFVNFFGGYYDAEDLVQSVLSRSRFYNGHVEDWEPDPLSVEVVAAHLIEGLSDDKDRELLARMFVSKEHLSDLNVTNLSLEATVVYELLTRPSFEDAVSSTNRLSSVTLDSLSLISPSTNIDKLKARVFIMHDREDPLVPSEESRRLAEALNDLGDTYYTEFSFFQHLDPTKSVSPPVYIQELFKLFFHMYEVINEIS